MSRPAAFPPASRHRRGGSTGVQDEFTIAAGVSAECRVVSLSGELDELAAADLAAALATYADGLPLIVDLTELTFICSYGLHALLRTPGRPPALVCPPGHVARVLGIVRADLTTSVFETLDAALEAVGVRTDASEVAAAVSQSSPS